jgi:DNA-binding transcriptional ArsR family regulator
MSRSERETNGTSIPSDIDRVIHEPARLAILSVLRAFETADFVFLLNQTQLSRGNLSSHLGKLEEAGYVEITKEFVDKVPRTLARLTRAGREAVEAYRTGMQEFLANL